MPKPLQPTPYVPPPRRKKPVALPRSGEARVPDPDPRVQTLIKEIAPLFRQEAIRKEAQKEAFKIELASKIKKKLKEEFKKELAEKLRKKIQIEMKGRRV